MKAILFLLLISSSIGTDARAYHICSTSNLLNGHISDCASWKPLNKVTSNSFWLKSRESVLLDKKIFLQTSINDNALENFRITGFSSPTYSNPLTIIDTSEIRFEYNAQSTSKTIILDGSYMDVKGVTYNGTITLKPYSSAVLIKNKVINTTLSNSNVNSTQLLNKTNLKTKNVVYQNFPNPFSESTIIRYEVGSKAPVKIIVYNAAGIAVALLIDEIKQPGAYQVQWNAKNFLSGIYSYLVIIDNSVTIKKMLKIR